MDQFKAGHQLELRNHGHDIRPGPENRLGAVQQPAGPVQPAGSGAAQGNRRAEEGLLKGEKAEQKELPAPEQAEPTGKEGRQEGGAQGGVADKAGA